MSESAASSSRGSRRSHHTESNHTRGAARPPQSPQSLSVGSPNGKPRNRPPPPSSPTSNSTISSSSNNSRSFRPLPSWCYVPPKENHSSLRKNVQLFGKKVDVYWCPHHERWDTHRLRECPIELQLESYKRQLEIFFLSRQELLETQAKLAESEQKVKNQRRRLATYEQKLRDAGIHTKKASSHLVNNDDDAIEHDSSREEASKSLKSESEEANDNVDTTGQLEAETPPSKVKKRQSSKRRSHRTSGDDQLQECSEELSVDELQRRLDETEKKSENRKNRIFQTETRYKEAKERLKEEQELCKKYKNQLEELSAENKNLERQLQEHGSLNGSPQSNNGDYGRRDEADKSIYRLSESLATVTGALESERAARITLETEFAIERREYEERLRDAQAELERLKMLLVAKKQTSTTSTGSFRSNSNYVKVCRLLVYSHHMVDDDRVQLIKETATKCSIGGFVKVGRPCLIVVEGLEEDCDSFLNGLAEQHRKLRESSRNGKGDTATFAAAGKVISQAETIDEGRAFPKELTKLDSESGLSDLKALCASTGMLDLIDEVCKR